MAKDKNTKKVGKKSKKKEKVKKYIRTPSQAHNKQLKPDPPFGTPAYSLRITTLVPPNPELLAQLLSDKFYYSYLLAPSPLEVFTISIAFDESNVELLKSAIPILMQNAQTNTVWCSLTTEYDFHGVTVPSYVLALLKADYIHGFDLSFIVLFR